MKQITFKHFLPGIAWFFFVLILLLIPGSEFPETDNWLKKIYFDKWVHAGLFGILSFLFMYPFRLRKNPGSIMIIVVILTSLWGLATEFLQESLVKGRSFELMDWAADTAGSIIAAIIFNMRWRKTQRI